MKNKLLKILIIILFVSLPISDMLRNTSFKDIELLGISIPELLNLLVIGISFIITLTKINRKKTYFLLIYLLILGIYLFLHYQNILKFDPNIYTIPNYSFFKETLYILRIYFFPILVILILIWNKDVFDKKFYSFVAKYLIAFISFSIIILDILKLSYPSYEDIVDVTYVPYSILDFYKYSGNPEDLLAKGWFGSANEISVILFALLPINIFLLYKENKINNVVIFTSQLLSMIIVGTRTSAYGSILIPCICLMLYMFFVSIKKNKFNFNFFLKFIIPFIFISIVFVYAPFRQYRRSIDSSRLEISNSDRISELLSNLDSDEDKIKAIKDHLYDFGISTDVEKLYPVDNDLSFWIEICKRDLSLNNNNRILKNDIVRRIKVRNNNSNDTFLGMHFLLDYMNIEKDYIYQYYLLGIIGLILSIGVYYTFYISAIIKLFKNFKEKFKFENILLFMAVSLELLIAYFSGHTFGTFFPMFILSLLISILNFYVVGDNYES